MDLVAIAPRGFEQVLREELGERLISEHGRVFFVRGQDPIYWAQNLWLSPRIFDFQSISQAAKHLRSIQRNWWLHSVDHHRRAKLIQGELPPIKSKRIDFLSPIPQAPLGSWTLLEPGKLLYSAQCSSAFPDGQIEFKENKLDPPSRAYLKLWEIFTLEGFHPSGGARVLDLGSSPGGWTWVLDQLGCDVISVDKAPLSKKTKFSERVEMLNESAFGLEPDRVGQVEWLFSDIICYPDRLLQLVRKWLDHIPNMICTIKFQGTTDHKTVKEFLMIPNSKVLHLSCNKHELTWVRYCKS